MTNATIENAAELEKVFHQSTNGIFKIKPRIFFKAVEDKFQSAVPLALQVPSSGIGSVTMLEAALLGSTIKLLEPKAIFEFGTFLGYSTSIFAKNSPSSCKIYSIDLGDLAESEGEKHDEWEILHNDIVNDNFLRSTQKSRGTYYLNSLQEEELKKVELFKMDSTTLNVNELGLTSKVDMVFIDGGHTMDIIKKDSENALEMIGGSGIRFWHDFNSQIHGDVTAYLNQYSSKEKIFHVEHTLLAFSMTEDVFFSMFNI